MPTLSVEQFLADKAALLDLEVLVGDVARSRAIEAPSISSPGLILSGFNDRAPRGRLQVLGETEVAFLRSLEDGDLEQALGRLFDLQMPAVVITKGQSVPDRLLEAAVERNVPVLRTSLKTGDFYRRLQPYLEGAFAPAVTLHGSMADVYGVGLMVVGRSGIGKSECVLDLVERGHRLVADDLVYASKRGNDVLIARGHELQRHHMEIRGIGIIDIPALFGIRSIRQQKRIEVMVRLVDWNERDTYERTGLETEQVEILGVPIPQVTIPLNPGKNITVISEVIAMNHLLKYSGVHAAERFNESLQAAMRPVRDYLEEDYE
ncbi:MAG TPA: HPr(Ser) kinase/phosphatase [Longimicrobiales bacterium]|nr:HPr(Ser) kinase/phosphatase [Longimicrobiales bacterium]